MVYNNAIPQPTDLISNSQAQLLENFAQLNTQFAVDHTSLISGSDNGRHQKVSLVRLVGDPAPVSTYGMTYGKLGNSKTEMYYEDNSGYVSQITGGGISASAWCVFDSTASSPITPGAAYNIASITVVANVYTVTFTRSFSSANYAVVVSPSLNTSSVVAVQFTQAPGNCTFQFRTAGVASTAGNNLSIVFYGTLA